MALRAPSQRGTSPGLVAPVPAALEAALRRAVLEHVSTERRRVFPPVVHLGTPGARSVVLPQEMSPHLPRPDHALRVDLVEALVRRHRANAVEDPPGSPVLLWCTRVGALEPEDDDLAWSSAARCAASELGISLPAVVVTRQGWRDPATGTGRAWRRLRPTRP